MSDLIEWVINKLKPQPTLKEYEASIVQALQNQREKEKLQTKQLTIQDRLVKNIPRTAGENARRLREFKKYKGMQSRLEHVSAAIARLEFIQQQIDNFRETAEEAKLTQSLPQMLARYNMPDIASIEKSIDEMQQMVTESQGIATAVSDGLAMSAMTSSGMMNGDVGMFEDPEQLEDELNEFLQESDVSQYSMDMSTNAQDTYPQQQYSQVSSVDDIRHRLPKVPTSKPNSAILNETLSNIGW